MALRSTLSYLLFPFTIWYAVGVRLRNLLYSIGLKKQTAPHITTISVGNLVTGGTGKTPHVEYLLNLLQDSYPTAMLSRGYRRKSKGLVVDDGTHSAAQLGDEPAMIAAKHPKVLVAVCEDRLHAIQHLMQLPEEEQPRLVILDDAFQHRRIKPSINILLTEYNNLFYNDHILPYGNLREFRSARNRAGIVVVTKCPEKLNPIDRHNISHDLKLENYQKIFFSYLKYGPLTDLDNNPVDLDLHRMDNLLVVTGIANPTPLIDELRRHSRLQHLPFPDHHTYNTHDIERIRTAFEALPGQRKTIITTEKDAIRLRPVASDLPFTIMHIEVAFHHDGDAGFDQLIVSTVRENISFLSKLSIWN